ncbi:MAG: aminopeptidase, partial [Candidatus Cloacimonadota bacterium]|nr:aminopeptidase [Candidatus Cloacimonadota bacterium]
EIFHSKQNALWYDMKQLDEAGFIKLVRTEKVRGTVKKYYRAVAKNYFVDISLGTANLEKTHLIHNLVDSEIEDWHREKIAKISFRDLAEKIINKNMAVKENEKIAISYQPVHQKLVEDLVVEIAKKGAYAIPIFGTKRMEYNFIRNVPVEHSCKDVIDDFLLEHIDAHIIFSGDFLDDSSLTKDMKEKSDLIEAAKRKNVRKTFKKDVRYLTIDTLQRNSFSDKSPHKKKGAEESEILRSELYWKALFTEPDVINEKTSYVKKQLEQAKQIKVEDGNGGYLNLKFQGTKHIIVKNGHLDHACDDTEIPGGLVVALLKNATINGNLHTDFAYLYDDEFLDVNIKIKNNKIIDIKADHDNEKLLSIFKAAEGDKDMIGSFCIGMNPAIRQNMHHLYINSKIFGGVSLQVGWDEADQSDIDSNMIAQFFLLNKTIYVDGKILFINGKLSEGTS